MDICFAGSPDLLPVQRFARSPCSSLFPSRSLRRRGERCIVLSGRCLQPTSANRKVAYFPSISLCGIIRVHQRSSAAKNSPRYSSYPGTGELDWPQIKMMNTDKDSRTVGNAPERGLACTARWTVRRCPSSGARRRDWRTEDLSFFAPIIFCGFIRVNLCGSVAKNSSAVFVLSRQSKT
jgi:hypothetical protein